MHRLCAGEESRTPGCLSVCPEYSLWCSQWGCCPLVSLKGIMGRAGFGRKLLAAAAPRSGGVGNLRADVACFRGWKRQQGASSVKQRQTVLTRLGSPRQPLMFSSVILKWVPPCLTPCCECFAGLWGSHCSVCAIPVPDRGSLLCRSNRLIK